MLSVDSIYAIGAAIVFVLVIIALWRMRTPERLFWQLGLALAFILVAIGAVINPTKYKLGPDLMGGTILVYQVNATEESVDMDDVTKALKDRLDPAGIYIFATLDE